MTDNSEATAAYRLAERIAAHYSHLPEVAAVTLGGSCAAGVADAISDIDLYVYAPDVPPLIERRSIAQQGGRNLELNNQDWEPGDEWIDSASNIGVDVMFRAPEWIAGQLDQLLRRYEPALGYTTALWHNVRTAQLLFDRNGWFAGLQNWATQPYPEPLRQAIIAKNYPVLRKRQSSYFHQISSAAARQDALSINHRLAALLASYFDIIFALNRQTHPGEKRMLTYARRDCPLLPVGMDEQLQALLATPCTDGQQVLAHTTTLLDGLDELLRSAEIIV